MLILYSEEFFVVVYYTVIANNILTTIKIQKHVLYNMHYTIQTSCIILSDFFKLVDQFIYNAAFSRF